MQKRQKSPAGLPGRGMKDWSTKGIKGYVRLMIEFLRLSPSYELARKYRNGELSKAEHAQLPDNFEQVLKTYDEYGNVGSLNFEDWWQRVGIYLYGTEFDKPQVRQIANIEKGDSFEPGFSRALEHYFQKLRPPEGNGPALVLAVPLGMNKRYIMRQITLLIDRAGVAVPVKAQKSKRPLTAERLRSEPLFKAIHLLWEKAQKPDQELWRLGLRANISPKNAEGLDINAKRNTTKTADQRIKMAILTSRALKKAKYICENAARGKFPCTVPIDLPEFDYADIYRRMRISRPKLKKA